MNKAKYYDVGGVQGYIQKLRDDLYEVQIVERNERSIDGKERFKYFFKNYASALNEILSYAEIDKEDFDK